jgi:predicted RNA-binding Zn-ribbon protein involved in translation (DUF1610 family)
MGLFCKHTFIPVTGGREIYCPKCGATKVVPCAHEWTETNEITTTINGMVSRYIYRHRCKKCGETKQERIL